VSGLAGPGEFADARGYLNTASFGLPPQAAFDAFCAAAERWRTGTAQPQDYDGGITRAREAFARLVNVEPARVAIGPQVSPLVGLVAAALPDGAEVLSVEGEFTSVIFPFLAQERRGVRTRLVPAAELAGEVRPSTSLVAFSVAQSADGHVTDLAAVTRAAAEVGARVMADATQAAGWLPLDASDVDFLVAGTYKWLLAPRGTAFLAVHPRRLDDLIPHAANWYGGDAIWDSIYGAPLRLSPEARRFDISPAWLCWIATLPALELIERIGVDAIHRHDVGLANRFRAAIGLEPSNTPIVSVTAPGAAGRLAAAGIAAANRAGAARISFHLYNTEQDADLAADALSRPSG
jgi:selenocysteine lyase/cysteine desulfurase